jgi:hypothetical protein
MAFHAYVISFCSRTDRSVHWLHYGRQGTGFALGFDVSRLIIRMAAPALKNRAFADEEEWRLMTYDLQHAGHRHGADGTRLAKQFRIMAGRIVPHVRLEFGRVPLTEIVLGSHVPMEVDDPALAILLQESGIDPSISVTRSPVPLRP